jgi:hypothetical protein
MKENRMRSHRRISLRCAIGLLVVLLPLAGCLGNDDDDDCGASAGKALRKTAIPPYVGEYMFERCTALEVSASRQQFAVGDTVTVALSCQPVYSGSGIAEVQFLPDRHADQSIEIVTPPDATPWGEHAFRARVRLDAGERFVMPWTVRVRAKSRHSIYAQVMFDSVFVEADSALYPVDSERAEQVHGPLDPRPAANYPGYVLAEPAAPAVP